MIKICEDEFYKRLRIFFIDLVFGLKPQGILIKTPKGFTSNVKAFYSSP